MKKNVGLLGFITIMLSVIVSAGPVDGLRQLADGLRGAIVVVVQFLGSTILDINSFGQFLFAKILLFSLILLIVFTVIKKNKIFGGSSNRTIQWIISSAVAILAVRYLPDNLVQMILIQYGALAVGLTVLLPFSIYFFFIHQSGVGPFGRRAGWVIFAIAFFALWSFRSADIGSANWIYSIGSALIIISIVFDRKIHRYFGLADFRKAEKSVMQKAIWDLEEERIKFNRRLKGEIITIEQYREGVERISNAIKAIKEKM